MVQIAQLLKIYLLVVHNILQFKHALLELLVQMVFVIGIVKQLHVIN